MSLCGGALLHQSSFSKSERPLFSIFYYFRSFTKCLRCLLSPDHCVTPLFISFLAFDPPYSITNNTVEIIAGVQHAGDPAVVFRPLLNLVVIALVRRRSLRRTSRSCPDVGALPGKFTPCIVRPYNSRQD